MEIWVEIKGYEKRYEVSSFGNVRSLDFSFLGKGGFEYERKGKILKYCKDKDGYKNVVLCVNQKRKTISIHRLVGLNFLQNPNNYPEIDHIDGNRENNNVENLRWATRKTNSNNPITRFRVSLSKKGNLNPKYKGI